MNRPVVVAVDVGGTSIKAATADAHGRLENRRAVPTPAADGPEAVLAAIVSVCGELADLTGALACAVVVPGSVDRDAGIARFSANLGWRDAPLRDLVRRRTGTPVVLDHDIRAGTVAEARVGASRGIDDSFVTILGTGIAGRLIRDREPVDGARGLAGEIGHVPVWPDGEPCPCGGRGCLERYASAAAVARHYEQVTGHRCSAGEVVRRLPGDPAAQAVWAEATRALALALTGCIMLCDPSAIVLAGGLSAAGDALLTPVRSGLQDLVRWRPVPRVAASPLGGAAGIIGAALLAWDAVGGTDPDTWRVQA